MRGNISPNSSKKGFPEGTVLFVFGTDTGVGKTRVCEVLLRGFRASGIKALPIKPVETGHAFYTRYSDAWRLSEVCNRLLPPEKISPFIFKYPLTPFLAARMEGKRLSKRQLLSFIKKMRRRCEILLVEGAGGILSPLSPTFDWLDIVELSGGAVVIVIGNRLGALNHALLTERAILERNLPCAGWFLNNLSEKRGIAERTNLSVLRRFMNTPFLGEIPFQKRVPDAATCEFLSRATLSSIRKIFGN